MAVVNYRNIRQAHLEFSPRLNTFIGKNGQGKTNLLESLAVLCSGRSFRTSEKDALIGMNSIPKAHIAGKVSSQGLTHNVSIGVEPAKKSIELNGKKSTSSQLKRLFPTVLFSPESLSIIKASASLRRKLIDDLGVALYPQYPQVYGDCERLLKQKNSILKKNREENYRNTDNQRLIHNLTDLFFAKSAHLIHERVEIIKKVTPFLKQSFAMIMEDPLAEVDVDYLVSGQSALHWNQTEIINALYNRWETLKAKEWASGLALVGPHKNDVLFSINGFEARKYCSQGQQRATILAFKLAHIGLHWSIHGFYPTLLLDDVLSELDSSKQRRFLERLSETDSQIFLTTTDAVELPLSGENRVFEVIAGQFSQKEGTWKGRRDWHRVMS